MKNNFLLFLFLILVAALFCGCSPSSEESAESIVSTPTSDEVVSTSEITTSDAYTALFNLLEKEKELVRLFFENGMYDLTAKTGNTCPVDATKSIEYKDFKNVNALFYFYDSPEDVRPFFYSYPTYGEKSVFERDEITYATRVNSINLPYPEKDDFVLTELSLDKAVFRLRIPDGDEFFTVDLEKNTLSTSPYMLKYSSDYTDKFPMTQKQSTRVNLGSAKKMLGDTLIVNVFITDKKSEWDDETVSSVIGEVEKAVEWLNKTAKERGVDLNMTTTSKQDSLYYRADSAVPSDNVNQIWINEMFAYTTYGTLEGYISSNIDLKKYDNYFVFFHLNKDGENNIGRYDSSVFEKNIYTVERAVMFMDSSEKSDYLKNILLAFGAEKTEKIKNEINGYFKNEIMNDAVLNDDSEISDLTAYLIGWSNNLHSQLNEPANRIIEIKNS